MAEAQTIATLGLSFLICLNTVLGLFPRVSLRIGISMSLKKLLVLCGLLIAVGLVARLTLIAYGKGSNDINLKQWHAQSTAELGIVHTYDRGDAANHPPLMFVYFREVLALSRLINLPFGQLFRLLVCLADLAVAAGLYFLWRSSGYSRSSALLISSLYFSNPASILFSAYHGNFDLLYGAFSIWSLYFLSLGHSALAGLLIATATNVKIVPLILLPVMLVLAHHRGGLKAFVAGGAVGLLPYFLLYLYGGPQPLRQIFGYQPTVNYWGIQGLLLLWYEGPSFDPGAWVPAPILQYRSIGGPLILALSIGLALWLSRVLQKVPQVDTSSLLRSTCACSVLIFLVFAPGFALQYLAVPLVLLFAASWRQGLIMSWLSGIMAGWAYYATLMPGPKWYSRWPGLYGNNIYFALFVWCLFVVCTVSLLSALTRAPTNADAAPRHPPL
jgi:hypothetical protein